ncbi:MAG: S41 family peptidase [Anaerolineae bacterium]|nr:S41 family peptidase [Anaerolineae bacterium]
MAGFGVCLVFWGERSRAEDVQNNPFVVFWEAWKHVEQNFYGPLPSPRERTYGAIRETLSTLGDPYTVFIEPQARAQEIVHLRGSYGDIGVTLWRREDGALLLYPLPDSPAARSGVLDGDILVAVDGEVISGTVSLDEVRTRIRGEVGTAVTLTISRPPAPLFDVIVLREEVLIPSVTWRVIDTDGVAIGYLRIESFTEKTQGETAAALQELTQRQVEGIILDLRGNSGGLVGAAVDVVGEFLKSGVVLIERRRDGERSVEVQDDGVAVELPLVVLVNGGTASAAEVVAGALHENGRALLIGERTYGKGSIQLVYGLSDGSALHVTTAVWLTPGHRQIDGLGITPDVHVPDEGEKDEQLDWAVEWFNSTLDMER